MEFPWLKSSLKRLQVSCKSRTIMESEDEKQTNLNLKIWMSNLPKELQVVPLNCLTIPGSHDSGSFALNTRYGVAPDKPRLRSSIWMKIFGFIALPFMKRWTKTQNLNITEQLECGIRYFDLRVASREGDNDLYFVHGLYANEINAICEEIKAFLDSNTKEIVIIDFQHFYSMNDTQHKQMIDSLMKIFGEKVCPFNQSLSLNQLTLKYLWSKAYQVLIFYRNQQMISYNKKLWPSSKLPNPWANTVDPKYLITFLDEHLKQRKEDTFYVTQGVLTPNNSCIVYHFYSTLYYHLVLGCNQSLSAWLNSETKGQKGPNIVMCDFVEWNNYRIPQKVVLLNHS